MLLEFIPNLLKGASLSLIVALLSLLFSSIFGLLFALMSLSKNKVISIFAKFYVVIVRGIPDLVLMLLIFYGGQMLVNELTDFLEWDYINVSSFVAGVFTLSFIFTAFMSETFRGAIIAVDKGQMEAAYCYGFSRKKIIITILIPQMMLHALPSYTNNWLVLLKATALLSIIGLHDLIYISASASSSTHQPFVFYFVASLFYLLITWISTKLLDYLRAYYHLDKNIA